jgi:hypothetical protein
VRKGRGATTTASTVANTLSAQADVRHAACVGSVEVLLARRLLRAGVLRTVLVVAVVGLAGGVAMIGAAGGRRASTAFTRFVEWSRPGDVATGGYGGDVPVGDRLHEVAALPSVTEWSRSETILAAGVEVGPGRVLGGARMTVVGIGTRSSGDWGRALVLKGAMPEARSTTQGVIDFQTAAELDLHVGDTVTVLAGERGDERIEIEIAAVIAYPSVFPTVAGWSSPALLLMPGFVQARPELLDPWAASLEMRLRDGLATLPELRAQLLELGLHDLDLPSTIDTARKGAGKITDLEAVGLWAAATVAAAVGAVVAYQLLRREATIAGAVAHTLAALGVRRRQVVRAALLRGTAIGGLAAVLATALALAASPLAPVGLSRMAEVDTGFHADLTVLVIGGAAIIVVTALAAGIAVAVAITPGRPSARSTPRVIGWVGAAAAVGTGLALGGSQERRSGRSVILVGAALAAAACVAVPVVAFGLGGVGDHPDRTGGVWDGFAHVDDPEMTDELGKHLRSVPEVDAVARGGWVPLASDDEFVFAVVLESGSGIEPALARGRIPAAYDEVALGAAALERLGVDVGDRVQLASPQSDDPKTFELTVVGEVIVTSTLFQTVAPDDGAMLPYAFVEESLGEAGWPYLVTFDEGIEPQEGMIAVEASAPEGVLSFAFARSERGDVLALETMETVAASLALVLLALLLLSVAHLVLVGTRRSHRQLAVLRAVGMTSRQMCVAGAVHGAVVAVVVVMLGYLLGAPAGAAAWRAIADSLVVVPTLDWWLAALLVGTFVTTALVVAVGALAALAVTRRSPAEMLRIE